MQKRTPFERKILALNIVTVLAFWGGLLAAIIITIKYFLL
jgi:hypothetical protein